MSNWHRIQSEMRAQLLQSCAQRERIEIAGSQADQKEGLKSLAPADGTLSLPMTFRRPGFGWPGLGS